MFKRYVKSLEDRIDSLEAFVCSLSYRLSEIDKLPKEECPVCKEIEAQSRTFAVDFTPGEDLIDAIEDADTAKTVVPWPVLSQKDEKP